MGKILVVTNDGTTQTLDTKLENDCMNIVMRLLFVQLTTIVTTMAAYNGRHYIDMISTKQLETLRTVANVVQRETITAQNILRYQDQLRKKQGLIDRFLGRTELLINRAHVVHSVASSISRYVSGVDSYLSEKKKVGRILSGSDTAHLDELYAKYVTTASIML